MQLYDVTSERFAKYGRIVTEVDCSELLKQLGNIAVPDEVVYEPSVPLLEQAVEGKDVNSLFGGLPFQIGYCAGHNVLLNAVEYHRSSEFNVAATEVILLLGRQQDIASGYRYHTEDMEAFLVPAGVTVELYATTLHYAPCRAQGKGFMVGVILPKGTNEPLQNVPKDINARVGEERLLTATNKWLIGHRDAKLPKETHLGLVGKNLNIENA